MRGVGAGELTLAAGKRVLRSSRNARLDAAPPALGKGYIDGGSYASREEAGLDLPNLDWVVFHAVMLLGNLTRRFPRHPPEAGFLPEFTDMVV